MTKDQDNGSSNCPPPNFHFHIAAIICALQECLGISEEISETTIKINSRNREREANFIACKRDTVSVEIYVLISLFFILVEYFMTKKR